jgi:hypothetical protein
MRTSARALAQRESEYERERDARERDAHAKTAAAPAAPAMAIFARTLLCFSMYLAASFLNDGFSWTAKVESVSSCATPCAEPGLSFSSSMIILTLWASSGVTVISKGRSIIDPEWQQSMTQNMCTPSGSGMTTCSSNQSPRAKGAVGPYMSVFSLHPHGLM